jgi:hypothetical protein
VAPHTNVPEVHAIYFSPFLQSALGLLTVFFEKGTTRGRRVAAVAATSPEIAEKHLNYGEYEAFQRI